MHVCVFPHGFRARTRAAESYRTAVSLGQAKVSLTDNFAGFWRDLAGVGPVEEAT